MASREEPVARAPSTVGDGTVRKLLPWIGLVAAAWALAAPYTGPGFNTAARVEVADHVVPGVAVLAASMATLTVSAGRRRALSPQALLVAGLVVCLAGLWMVLTHIPLVAQATRGETPWAGAVWHTSTAVFTLAVGVVWVAAHWSGAGGPSSQP